MHAHHCPPDPSTPLAAETGDHSPVPRSRPALVHARLRNRGPAGHVVAEWERLARSRALLRHVNSWDFLMTPVDHIDEVLEVCGFGKRVDDSDADHMFLCLVRLAAHDDLAARIALHRVLPAIMAIEQVSYPKPWTPGVFQSEIDLSRRGVERMVQIASRRPRACAIKKGSSRAALDRLRSETDQSGFASSRRRMRSARTSGSRPILLIKCVMSINSSA